MATFPASLGEPSERRNLQQWEWLKNNKPIAIVWTVMRIWLGVMWAQAGWAKLFGAENAAFLHNDGAGVKGFAAHGAPAYSWWGSFLHSFVVPNSGWIGILVGRRWPRTVAAR
jgi:thiosulfate dehydrogenase [quinone] large subunit